MRSIQVTLQLQKQDNNKTKQISVSVHIKHSMTANSTENNNGDNRKYIMCSLLLQLGKILGIQPSYAPSPYISTIFTEIYNKWSLKCIESNTQYTRSIKQLTDITDGNELILCCGSYYKESAASMSNNCGLIDLIPSKCKIVTVSIVKDTDNMLPSATNASVKSNNKDESDSDIEDVTELYAAKHKANQEVIDIDSGSDDEDDCFWEYDEFGNMKKTEARSLFEYKSEDDDVISISSGDSSSVEDVTAIMLEKRAAQAQTMRDNAEEINDDDSDQDEKQLAAMAKKRKRHRSPSTTKRRKRKKVTESPIEVVLEDKDIPVCPGAAKVTQDDNNEGQDSSTNAKDKEQADQSIKKRIIKLLNTGFHNNSNENEAKNAMKLARRLMERHNLDHALLLQERGDGSLNDCSTANDADGLQGGIVTTKIQNRKNSKPLSSLSRWQDFLVGCTCMNFNVEAFKSVSRGTPSRKGECSVTFYGIRVNAQLAAYAFKIVSERISLMAATYEPSRVSTLTAASQKAKETKAARLSYALGIVNGLEQDVKEGQRKEEENRKEKLRRAQQRANSGEAHQESDDESQQGELAKDEASSNDLNKLERENTAHLALIDHHKKIATDVLKAKKIKVRSARKPKSILLNRNAYEKGMVDSKEIDLNQQSIK